MVAVDPGRYFEEQPHLKEVISSLKESGKRLIFASNSPFWYVDAGMKHVIGDALESQRTVHKTVFNLGFKPTQTSHPIIEHIQVEIGSLCEMQISYDGAGLYRDPIAVKAQLEKMRWESKCPSVTFSKSTVIDSEITRANSTAPPLRLVVVNPDSGNLWDSSTRLEKVVVQYRPLSGGEWITAKEDDVKYKSDSYKKNLICEHSRTSGCTWDWDLNNKYDKLLSGYKDGAYEVRVKNFCSGGDAFAATEVHEYVGDKTLLLFTDTKNPLVEQHVSSPAARTVTIVYAEEIDCADPPTFEVAQTHDESCVAVAGDGTVSAAIIRESYEQTCLNTGVQGKVSYQMTPHVRLDSWISNEVPANQTQTNGELDNDDITIGLNFTLTANPVTYKKNNGHYK